MKGRIGIIGGSNHYTGAPYFAAISALRTGCDLVHVFCEESAGVVIKGYSPELIVHPIMKSLIKSNTSSTEAKAFFTAEFNAWIERIDVFVVGPGLSRDSLMLSLAEEAIKIIKSHSIPLIIDGDGICLLERNPELLLGSKSIITPNHNEFARLCSAMDVNDQNLALKFPDSLIIRKGAKDEIFNSHQSITVSETGSMRRCGGQGDILAGILATFYSWCIKGKNGPFLACEAASILTRACSKAAFHENGRSMLAQDVIKHIPREFQERFE